MAAFSVKKALAAAAERRKQAGDEPLRPTVAPNPNNPEQRIAQAQALEADILEKIAWTEKQKPRTELIKMRLESLFDRLGELAAEQGDYERAYTVTQTPERRTYYKSLIKALNVDDTKECKCAPDNIVDRRNQREFKSPAIMTVDTLVAPDGTLKKLDQCRKCGFRNVR
jgi:hypothetical protein